MDRDRPRLGTSGDNANNSDDKDRPQMADNDDTDSQALTNVDITRYRALVARSSYLSQDRPDLKFCIDAGVLCDGEADHARHGTRQEDWSIPRWEAERGSSLVSWRRIRMLTGRRQSHSTKSVGVGHQERRTLPQGMN